ncbi:MAG TPA: transposase family protein [Pyrinomonadaceae bacterium]|nr:transposase family protein [Pyrinomonadaceae bacterium]
MSVYEKYKMKKPAQFTRLVGVNFGTFQIILEKLKAEIISYKQAKPMRQRGLTSSLSIEDQLLLTLIYLRQYHTFLQPGEMFSISESYAFKHYRFISKRLLKALDLPNDQALTSDNLKVVADVTEQAIERPVKKQKSYYSGKKNGAKGLKFFKNRGLKNHKTAQ